MSKENGFTKGKIITLVAIIFTVIALGVTMVLVLGADPDDRPTQGGATQGTNSQETDPAETDPTETVPAPKVYTVTFLDHNGIVLSTQKVEEGKGAVAPKDPTREHFTFAGWDKAFDKITGDLTVTATYTTTKTVIYAESVTVNKSAGEVKVNIRVLNNPGIMGAVLKVSVDDKAFSFVGATKSGYPGLTLTNPGPGTTASPYTFMLDALELSAEDEKDGTLITVTLKIKDAAAAGKYAVELSYDNGAIFDKNYKDPKVGLENGTITIS